MNTMQTNAKECKSQSTGGEDALRREQLSALADGQLDGDAFAAALEFAAEEDGQATWQLYQLVGDVLRSPDLAQPADPAFMARLRDQLALEPRPVRVAATLQTETIVTVPAQAANASVFRWKMAAGFASLAAVAAIGWSALATLQTPGASGAQLAVATDRSAAPVTPVVAVADADGQQIMIRDPRLDELLAAHKQFGSTSALQMPAGFLRNATFDTTGR